MSLNYRYLYSTARNMLINEWIKALSILNFSLGTLILCCGATYSMVRSQNVKVQIAGSQIEVTNAISQVEKLSKELEQTTERLPISQSEKNSIKSELVQIEQAIATTEEEIEQNLSELIDENN